MVDETERADARTVRTMDRLAGVEAHMRRASHQRIVAKAFIQKRSRHHERAFAQNRVAAKRYLTTGLAGPETLL